MNTQGIRVLRFWNHEVFENIEGGIFQKIFSDFHHIFLVTKTHFNVDLSKFLVDDQLLNLHL